jgi:hypothetical protein
MFAMPPLNDRPADPSAAATSNGKPFWITVLAAALLCVGCAKRDEITLYTVRSEAALLKENSVPKAMIGVIAAHGGETWFFKLSGSAPDIAAAKESFTKFLGRVRFEDGEPTWKLPEGWVEKGPAPLRFATIEVPAPAMPLDLSISSLPTPAGDEQPFVLANVNRWRGQLGLEPLTAEQLDEELSDLTLGDGTAASLMIADSRPND